MQPKTLCPSELTNPKSADALAYTASDLGCLQKAGERFWRGDVLEVENASPFELTVTPSLGLRRFNGTRT